MAYRAQRQSLFGGVGGPQPPQGPQVDVPGAIDALTSGASSIIHQALLRRQGENEIEQQRQARVDAAAERQYQHGRDAAGDARLDADRASREADRTLAQSNADREYELRAEKQRQEALMNGVTPAHDETSFQSTGYTSGPAIQSPIHAAMTAPPDANGIPAQQMTPERAPSMPTALPTSGDQTTHVSESYDPSKAQKYLVEGLKQQGLATREEHRQEFTAEQQATRLAAQQAGRAYAADRNEGAIRLRHLLDEKAKSDPVSKAMSGNALNAYNMQTAAGYLERHGGNLQDALDDLNGTTEGLALQKAGVTSQHLTAAYGAWSKKTTEEALKFQQPPIIPLKPDSAVKVVNSTQKQVREQSGATSPPQRIGTQGDSVKPPPKPPTTKGDFTDGAPQPKPTLDDKEISARSAWVAANKPKAGETRAEYEARYLASKKKGG